MASFAPIRGTKTQIANTPRVDGQFLIETDQGNQNKIYVDTLVSGNLERSMAGGGGHVILPDPEGTGASAPSEETVVDAVTTAASTTDKIASLYGIQRWSNVKTIRVLSPANSIGHTGIGTWKDGTIDPSTDEADWWQNNYFQLLDNSDPSVDGYDVDFSIKLDPQGGEVITLGGYIVDTTTGKICIKFGNYVVDPSNAKIAVDITFTRTDVG